jgi:hypothetical protein
MLVPYLPLWTTPIQFRLPVTRNDRRIFLSYMASVGATSNPLLPLARHLPLVADPRNKAPQR